MGLQVASVVRGAQAQGQDRADVLQSAEGLVIVVADGAGGIIGGGEAADAVLAAFRMLPPTRDAITKYGFGARELLALDEMMYDDPQCGQAAAVAVAIGHGMVVGASVGDSQAWLIDQTGHASLTAGQARTPFLGSGGAVPRAFKTDAVQARLLVATDGLFRYAAAEDICEAARTGRVEDAAGALIELAQLPSGELMDDVAVVLCEVPGGAPDE